MKIYITHSGELKREETNIKSNRNKNLPKQLQK